MSDITVALLVLCLLLGVIFLALFAVGGAPKETNRVRNKHTARPDQPTPDIDYGDDDYSSDD